MPDEASKPRRKRARPLLAGMGLETPVVKPMPPPPPVEASDDEDEARLTRLVFGQGSGIFSQFGMEASAHTSTGAAREGGQSDGEEDEQLASSDSEERPAWQDDDDDQLQVDISAKARLKKLRAVEGEGMMTGVEFQKKLQARFKHSQGAADWATTAKRRVDRADDSSDEEEEPLADATELLRGTASFRGSRGAQLQPGVLDIARCRDANQHAPSKSGITSVHFHREGGLLLAGGLDKSLRFFQVDGKDNPKLHGVHFEDMAVHQAQFTLDDQVIVTGRRPWFYWYDVQSGKVNKVHKLASGGDRDKALGTFACSPDGRFIAFLKMNGLIVLVSNRTKQWIADFKMNSWAKSLTFTADSQFVLGGSIDGEIYKFDVRSRRCVLRFYNEGGTGTGSLAVSPGSALPITAIGSESGVVNVYDDTALQGGKVGVLRPVPRKALMNITTSVTSLKFNHDAQVMAMASSDLRDALKLVHMPSCTVFTNWPTGMTPIRRPLCLDFSHNGAYLAIGNDRGRVLLYRLRHYGAN